MTPQEPLRRFYGLQELATYTLLSNPAGNARFWQRRISTRYAPSDYRFHAPQNELALHLRDSGVPFLLLGAHAVAYHGHVHATDQVEVAWLRTPESERRLEEALSAAGAAATEGQPYRGTLYWSRVGLALLHDRIATFPSEAVDVWISRCVADDEGLRYPSAEDLRRLLLASGKVMDRVDLEMLGWDLMPPPTPRDHP